TAFTVSVQDYNLANESHTSGNVNRGASIQETFDVSSVNNYAGALALSCGSLPANTTCTFAGTGVTGSTLNLTAGMTTTITVTISTTTSATAATTPITFKVDATVPAARSKTLPYALTINSAIANADLDIVTGSNQSPANPIVSGNVTYNLTVKSNGPDPASNVTVVSNTPAGYAFVSATPSVGSCNSALPISCNLGLYNSGDSHTIAVVLTPALSSAGINVTFTVSSGTADNTAANNTKTFTTTTPDYTLAASNSPLIAFPSQAISLQGNA